MSAYLTRLDLETHQTVQLSFWEICSGQSEPRVGAALASPASLRLKFPAATAAQITRKTQKVQFYKVQNQQK